MKYVVDTHALVWYLCQSPRLGENARRILNDPESEIILPATAFAEVCWIIEHKPDKFAGLKVSDVISTIDRDGRIIITPLTREVVEQSIRLNSVSEMHDRHIAATALLLEEGGETAALITSDSNIVASGLVTVLW